MKAKSRTFIRVVLLCLVAAAVSAFLTYKFSSEIRQWQYDRAMNQTFLLEDGTEFELRDISIRGDMILINGLVESPKSLALRNSFNFELLDSGKPMFRYGRPRYVPHGDSWRGRWEGTIGRYTDTPALQLRIIYTPKVRDGTYYVSAGEKETVTAEVPNPMAHYGVHRMRLTANEIWSGNKNELKTVITSNDAPGKSR